MLTLTTLQSLIPFALLLHAVAHAIALGGLLAQIVRGGSASRMLVRSWLFPSLSAKAAAAAALPFWLVATLGFVGASMVFDGILAGGEAWRQVAVLAALVSVLGSALFSGIWPGAQNSSRSILNTCVSLAMNIAILVSQLWLHWPPAASG